VAIKIRNFRKMEYFVVKINLYRHSIRATAL
jgi:hypothetical protein